MTDRAIHDRGPNRPRERSACRIGAADRSERSVCRIARATARRHRLARHLVPRALHEPREPICRNGRPAPPATRRARTTPQYGATTPVNDSPEPAPHDSRDPRSAKTIQSPHPADSRGARKRVTPDDPRADWPGSPSDRSPLTAMPPYANRAAARAEHGRRRHDFDTSAYPDPRVAGAGRLPHPSACQPHARRADERAAITRQALSARAGSRRMPAPHDDEFYDDAPRGDRRKGLYDRRGRAGARRGRHRRGVRLSQHVRRAGPVGAAAGDPRQRRAEQGGAAAGARADPIGRQVQLRPFRRSPARTSRWWCARRSRSTSKAPRRRRAPCSRARRSQRHPRSLPAEQRCRGQRRRAHRRAAAGTHLRRSSGDARRTPSISAIAAADRPVARAPGRCAPPRTPVPPPRYARRAARPGPRVGARRAAPRRPANAPLSLAPTRHAPPPVAQDNGPPPPLPLVAARSRPVPAPAAGRRRRRRVRGAGVVAAERGRGRKRLSRHLKSKYTSVLSGQPHTVRRADLGAKGVVLPRHGRALGTRDQAIQLCSNLKAGRRRLRCVPTERTRFALTLRRGAS